jgi:rod shape-determining protein MreC
MQKGDLLTTSGIDGVYPAGLHVGRIARIDRRVDSSFARVHAEPMPTERGRHLLVLQPVKDWPEPPKPEPTKAPKVKAAAPTMPAAGAKP